MSKKNGNGNGKARDRHFMTSQQIENTKHKVKQMVEQADMLDDDDLATASESELANSLRNKAGKLALKVVMAL